MMIKAIRTPQHQPEGSPEYAECSNFWPRFGGVFFFPAAPGAAI
jgi:hypothetical protein